MKRSARLAAAALAVGPLAGAGLLSGTAVAASPQTIKFTAIQYHATQKGKVQSFQEHLISAGRTIGHDSVSCTAGAHSSNCVGTFFFTSGKVNVKISVGAAKVDHGVVTSTTGRYAGLKGTFTLTTVSSSKTNIVISLH
jgi:hypothetical protein